MADDWDTVTHIGSKRSGGDGGNRGRVVRSQGALNAARRTGAIVNTEKRVGTPNSRNQEGQRAKKVADADGPIAVPLNNRTVAAVVNREIAKQGFSHKSLAQKIPKCSASDIAQVANPNGPKPSADLLRALQNVLGVNLLGRDIGELTKAGKQRAKKAAEAEEAKKVAEAAKEAGAEDAEGPEGAAAEAEGAEAEDAEGAGDADGAEEIAKAAQ